MTIHLSENQELFSSTSLATSIIGNPSHLLISNGSIRITVITSIIKLSNLITSGIIDMNLTTRYICFILVQMKMNITNRASMCLGQCNFHIEPTIPRDGIKPRGISIEKTL